MQAPILDLPRTLGDELSLHKTMWICDKSSKLTKNKNYPELLVGIGIIVKSLN